MPRKKQLNSKNDQSGMEEHINIAKVNRERILIRVVTAISRACIMHANRSTRHFGLSISQAIVLSEMFRYNGCRQEDLRTFVSLDKGNVTRAVQQLEEFGLVQRKQDPVDRRAVRVYVTQKALALEKDMYAIACLWDERLTEGFTPEERAKLIDLLLRMEVNAKAMAAEKETV